MLIAIFSSVLVSLSFFLICCILQISPFPVDATKDPPMPLTNPTSSYAEDNTSKIEVLEYGSVFKDLETSSSGSDYSSDRLSRRDSNDNLSNSSSSSSSEDSDS